MLPFGEKVAVITGGTSGIGARMGEVFVANGAKVVIAGRQFSKRTSNGRAGSYPVETRVGSLHLILRLNISGTQGDT